MIIAFAMLALVFGAMLSASAGSSKSNGVKLKAPTKPPFMVDKSGRIIPESVPDTIGVAGPDGTISKRITKEEFLAMWSAPNGPPGSTATRGAWVGPQPDQVITVEESAAGRLITTTKDFGTDELTRVETSPDGATIKSVGVLEGQE